MATAPMCEPTTYRVEIVRRPNDFQTYRVYVYDSNGKMIDWGFADTKWGARCRARRAIEADRRRRQGSVLVKSYEVRA